MTWVVGTQGSYIDVASWNIVAAPMSIRSDQSLSCVRLFVTLWTAACQAPLSMGFSRQEYWSGLSFPSPGDLPDPGIETECSAPPALVGNVLDDSLLIHETCVHTSILGHC